MANAAITAWLNQPEKNYDTGVLLYGQFGTSALLKSFFKNGKGAYHLSRLIDTLHKLNPEILENKQPVAMILPPVPVIQPHRQQKNLSLSDSEWNQSPEWLKDLYALNSQLKSHAELLHHGIRIAPSADQRRTMAIQLLEARDQRNENWKIIKDYRETSKLREQIIGESEKSIDEHTMVELTAILKNFPTYLSKDRAKLAALAEGSKKEKILTRIREREVQLDLAKKRLENVRII